VTPKSIRIDALRGCAILAVVQYHYGSCFGLYSWLGPPAIIQKLLGYGWAGVDLFFVLSAYLLTRNLLGRRGEPDVVQTFYRRRILRILPLYLVLLAAAAVLREIFQPEAGGRGAWLFGGLAPLWVYGAFLQNYWFGLYQEIDGFFLNSTWSLAVEEHFYLILPLLILRLRDRRIVFLSLAFIILAPVLRMEISTHFGGIASNAWSICRLDSFAWGILIALGSRLDATTQSRLKAAWVIASVIGIIWLAYRSVTTGVVSPSDPLMLSVIATVAARAVFATAAPADRLAAPNLAVSAIAWAGSRCYSIYLLHMPVIGLTALALGNETPLVNSAETATTVGLAFLVMLLLAELSYRYIERPFIAYGERQAAYKGGASAQTAS
jgi:peptidoglycan/LPS O-acetylase OafA/YrhL